MTIDFEKVETHDVIVEGQRVRVRLDQKGKVIAVSTGSWLGGDRERIAKLAMAYARSQFERKAKSEHDAVRIDKSTKTKRTRAAEHWTNEWLEAAHQTHPDFRGERLAQAARHLVAMNGPDKPEYTRRPEITEYRAEQFLKKRFAK